MPPSTASWPLMTAGGKMPGSDTLARSARGSEPRSCTCTVPLPRLLDTQKNGIGRSSIWPGRCSSISRSMRRPRRNEMIGNVMSPNGLPATNATRARSIAICGLETGGHAGGHDGADARAAEPVDAACPASCSARYTPRCAKPRAAPPPSTRPTARARDHARQSVEVVGHPGAQVQVEIEPSVLEPGRRAFESLGSAVVAQHERTSRHRARPRFRTPRVPRAVRAGRRSPAPPAGSGRRGAARCRRTTSPRIAHVEHEAMLVLLDREPVDHRG